MASEAWAARAAEAAGCRACGLWANATRGAPAAQSLLGPSFRLTAHQREVFEDTGLAAHVLATTHPSLVLRGPDPAMREATRGRMVAGLARAGEFLR